MANTVHRMKVSLRHIKPPVWRRIVVRSDTTLDDLAPILEAAMGWLGGHLHAYETADARYAMPDPDWPDDDLDERRFRLRSVLPAVGSKLRWDYDFGDGWEHNVVVEEIGPMERDVEYPICLAGRRACPPEDCGGPWGYADLLEILADPTHPRYEEMSEWAPPNFDPGHFDRDETTFSMRSPLPIWEW